MIAGDTYDARSTPRTQVLRGEIAARELTHNATALLPSNGRRTLWRETSRCSAWSVVAPIEPVVRRWRRLPGRINASSISRTTAAHVHSADRPRRSAAIRHCGWYRYWRRPSASRPVAWRWAVGFGGDPHVGPRRRDRKRLSPIPRPGATPPQCRLHLAGDGADLVGAQAWMTQCKIAGEDRRRGAQHPQWRRVYEQSPYRRCRQCRLAQE